MRNVKRRVLDVHLRVLAVFLWDARADELRVHALGLCDFSPYYLPQYHCCPPSPLSPRISPHESEYRPAPRHAYTRPLPSRSCALPCSWCPDSPSHITSPALPPQPDACPPRSPRPNFPRRPLVVDEAHVHGRQSSKRTAVMPRAFPIFLSSYARDAITAVIAYPPFFAVAHTSA
jgi:hypothetical protein